MRSENSKQVNSKPGKIILHSLSHYTLIFLNIKETKNIKIITYYTVCGSDNKIRILNCMVGQKWAKKAYISNFTFVDVPFPTPLLSLQHFSTKIDRGKFFFLFITIDSLVVPPNALNSSTLKSPK